MFIMYKIDSWGGVGRSNKRSLEQTRIMTICDLWWTSTVWTG